MLQVVSTLITEMGVFTVQPGGAGLELTEIADGVSLDDLRAATEAEFRVADSLVPIRTSL